jgi:hypothetical protein
MKRKINLRIISTFFIFLIVTGCKKEAVFNVTFKGKVLDDKNGIPVKTGKIFVAGIHQVGSGIFGYKEEKLLGGSNFDINGNFYLSFKKWDLATTFSFYFDNTEGYFTKSFDIDIQNLQDFTDTILPLTKITYLKINFENINPVNPEDEMSFSNYILDDPQFGYIGKPCNRVYTRGGHDPNNSLIIKGNSAGYNLCPVPAERNIAIHWLVRKNNIQSIYRDTIFCQRDLTTNYEIRY